MYIPRYLLNGFLIIYLSYFQKAVHEVREAFEVTRISGPGAKFPDNEAPDLRYIPFSDLVGFSETCTYV